MDHEYLDSEAAAATHAALAAPDALKSYLVLARGSTDLAFESRRPLHSEAGKPQEAHTSFRRLAEIDGFTRARSTSTTPRNAAQRPGVPLVWKSSTR